MSCTALSPWFSTDGWKSTNTSAVQLVPPTSAHDLKIQCLVKLAQILRGEAQSNHHFTLSRDHPAEKLQSVNLGGT